MFDIKTVRTVNRKAKEYLDCKKDFSNIQVISNLQSVQNDVWNCLKTGVFLSTGEKANIQKNDNYW